uniref:Uncharacterized protein n=1 Tax=Neobodo designis TaxID=312471 RepID=A0A7S1QP90_NEODS|mmetsp:Transcript_49716/g.153629  ORF Transcript_49716/g.153629 Transcript_49716/m.153629 type:complete len:133 (+) Transcript_49716:145-543(+)
MAANTSASLIPVTVHRGDRTACVAADAAASSGTIAKKAFAMMEVEVPPGFGVGLAKADGGVIDLSERVEARATLYAVMRLPDGSWEAPSRPTTLQPASLGEGGDAEHGCLTQRLPPALAQYVMAQRPSPVVL